MSEMLGLGADPSRFAHQLHKALAHQVVFNGVEHPHQIQGFASIQDVCIRGADRSELQSQSTISYAVFCLKKKTNPLL